MISFLTVGSRMATLRDVLLYPAELLAVLTFLTLLAGLRVKPWLIWSVAAVGVVVLAIVPFVDYPQGQDLAVFHDAGAAVWRGDNPYEAGKLLSPPTALPLFALLALVPFDALLAAWTAANVLMCLALVPLAALALRAQASMAGDNEASWTPAPLPASILLLLAVLVSLSFSARYGLLLGQLAVVTAALLIGALYLQGRRPLLAGALLAIASIKVGTMLPFLLLFLRVRGTHNRSEASSGGEVGSEGSADGRSPAGTTGSAAKTDWRAWLAMTVVGFGLCLTVIPPLEIVDRCRDCLRNIGNFSGEGTYNDYSYANPSSQEVLGFDHLLFRVGVKDRSMNRLAQLAILGLVGGWLGWQIVTGRIPRGGACALVALYSMLFLYHRIYDLVILALPLVYATRRALCERGRARLWFALAALMPALALYFQVGPSRMLLDWAVNHPGIAAAIVEGTLVAAADWAVVLGMAFLVVAEKSHAAG